jgi:hypothetical protein
VITNIVDQRKRRHRWKRVHVVAEATWHDNSVTDADQAAPGDESVDYDEMDDVTLAHAIVWGQGLPGEVTLFIYDASDPSLNAGSTTTR